MSVYVCANCRKETEKRFFCSPECQALYFDEVRVAEPDTPMLMLSPQNGRK